VVRAPLICLVIRLGTRHRLARAPTDAGRWRRERPSRRAVLSLRASESLFGLRTRVNTRSIRRLGLCGASRGHAEAEGNQGPGEGRRGPDRGSGCPTRGDGCPLEGGRSPREGRRRPNGGRRCPELGSPGPRRGSHCPSEGHDGPSCGGRREPLLRRRDCVVWPPRGEREVHLSTADSRRAFAPPTHWGWDIRHFARPVPVKPGDEIPLRGELQQWLERQALAVELV
jgi:hypothetical protein